MSGDFERIKEAVDLEEYATDNLEHVRGGLVCPSCGSGKHANGTPAFKIKGKSWKCFSAGCEKGGDVFDLAGIIHNTEDRREQLRLVAEWARVDLENATDGPRGFKQKWPEIAEREKQEEKPAPDYSQGRAKHRQYVAECARRMVEQPNEEIDAYLMARGIDHDTAVKLGIGYDLHAKLPWITSDGVKKWGARIVIPWEGSDYYHVDRAVDDKAKDKKYGKPKSEEVGGQPPFNPAAFGHDYVIVCEGPFDALAVQLCGYNAVCLEGCASVDAFVKQCKARHYSGVVVEMLDAGVFELTNGVKAGRELVEKLQTYDKENPFVVQTLAREEYGIGETDTYGGHKDAGEWFAADRDGLAAKLAEMRTLALDKLDREGEREYMEALRSLKVEDTGEIALSFLSFSDVEKPVETGLHGLDRALNGGLRAGLTVLGAVSSAGKTTLLNQIADHIAANGRPVLFVSIEQSGRELVAKSISRIMHARNYTGVTLWEMTSTRYRGLWPADKEEALGAAAVEYGQEVAPNMHIMAASEQPAVDQVKKAAYAIARRCGVAPVIFIDYLQILKPANERDTERKAVDANISELRRLAGSNGLNTPVVVISSLNRASYTGTIEMESFKESGGVEYGSDVLLGLQPAGLKKKLNEKDEKGYPKYTEQQKRFIAAEMVDKFRREDIKAAEIEILKNRNGALPEKPIPITFYAASSLFVDGQAGE